MAIIRSHIFPREPLQSLNLSTISKSGQYLSKKACRKEKKASQAIVVAHSDDRKDTKCTRILIILNVIFYLLTKGIPIPSFLQKNKYLLSPDIPLFQSLMKSNLAIEKGETYRIYTCLFLHDDFSHLFFNLVSLYELGNEFESIHGSKNTLRVYLLSGAGANFLTYLCGLSPLSIGASGAIFGLYGCFLSQHRKSVDWKQVWLNLLFNVLFGIVSERVDHAGHIFGFLIGATIPHLFSLPVSKG